MKDPQKFDEFMTALSLISFALGLVSSLAGAAMPYVKGERKFMFYRYIVEVATSAIAGVVVFLLLKVTDIPEEWIAALTGISSFYGTRLMNVLYGLLVGRLKIIFLDSSKDEGRKKDDEQKRNHRDA